MISRESTQKIEFPLNGEWRFNSFNRGDGEKLKLHSENFSLDNWFQGNVPGSVQGDLLSLGDLPDPFFNQNAYQYRFIEEKEWWYAKEFTLPKNFQDKELFLKFEGIDTVSYIYLNGKRIAKTKNMFTPYEFKVADFLTPGKNRLLVKLEPVIKVGKEKDKRGFIKDDWHTSAYIRKANFAYGGDMSQRLITVGIWRSVKIIGYDKARILNAQVITSLKNKNKKATISLSVEIEKFSSEELPLVLEIKVTQKNNHIINKKVPLILKGKKKVKKISFDIPDPKLWWPNGTGEQNLYNLSIELIDKRNCSIDIYEDRFGIRDVKLLQEEDKKEGGKTFTFVINGVKIFAKGANWVPADNLMYPIPKERYRNLIRLAKEANFNMFRINGFGIYEDEEFYRACDEMGIMIWHDFMFSDCMYPDDDEDFLKECRREGEIVVKSLRNHPCIALWCGNNEVDEIYYISGHSREEWKFWGEKIFHEILPEVCKRLDPTRPYWPSSAWSAPGKFPLWKEMGDYHFYPVSSSGSRSSAGFRPTQHPYGKRILLPLSLENTSYRRYAKEKAKFYSEFGLASLPSIGSLKKTTDGNLWPIENNPFWEYHIAPSWPKPVKRFIEITNLLNSEFGESKDINDFILYSQISQAATLKFAAEHFRAREFSCSGALFWQYNDCWPTLTCSMIDYYLDKKIAYYWAKKAFAPLLITFIERGDYLEIWVVNDFLSEPKGAFILSKMDFFGEVSLNEEREIKIPSNSSVKIKEIKLSGLKVDKRSEFLWARLKVKEKTVAENRHFFSLQRDLSFPKCNLRKKVERKGKGRYEVFISSDTYALLVRIETGGIECELSDNFFDLAPRESKKIIATLKDEIEVFNSLKIGALNS